MLLSVSLYELRLYCTLPVHTVYELQYTVQYSGVFSYILVLHIDTVPVLILYWHSLNSKFINYFEIAATVSAGETAAVDG